MPEQYPGTIKYKKSRRRVNIGIIICILIIVYFIAYFCDFVFNRRDSFYEVVQGSTSSKFDGQYTALIIRSEKVVSSGSSGYVYFFAGDEVPVYSGQQAYLIDRSGQLSAMLQTAAQTQAIMNENDLTQLKDSLYHFRSSFKPNEYYDTYHFKYQIESQILDMINSSLFMNNELMYSGSYEIFNAEAAGIVMHYVDGFEDLTADSFEASSFRKAQYNKKIIRNNDYVELGSPVYKIITSDDWNLVLQINDPASFSELGSRISLEFLKDNITVDADYEIITRGGNYYCIISLDKYMIRYASDRYTQISLASNTQSGLKIPKTAYTERQYYAIPLEYRSLGSNSSETGFAVRTQDETGKETVVIRYPEIVKTDDQLYYISMDDPEIHPGDVIVKNDSSNDFTVGMTARIPGVYIYNRGYTTFRLVEPLGEIDGYYIVDADTQNGVKMYDQVYVDYHDAED